MSNRISYTVLASGDVEDEEDTFKLYQSKTSYFRFGLSTCVHFSVHLILVVILVVVIYRQNQERQCLLPSPPTYNTMLYSPARHILEPRVQVFTRKSNGTIYQGMPSPAVDQAWLDLYNDFGITKISKSEAKLLPNKTSAIPGDKENYIVSLSVFHQLHCLNMIRKTLYSDYYADPVTGYIAGIAPVDLNNHLNHCIEGIRQSLLCSSDISVMVWQWDSTRGKSMPRVDTAHSCWNFDKIMGWAKENSDVHFDESIRVEDDFVIPAFNL